MPSAYRTFKKPFDIKACRDLLSELYIIKGEAPIHLNIPEKSFYELVTSLENDNKNYRYNGSGSVEVDGCKVFALTNKTFSYDFRSI